MPRQPLTRRNGLLSACEACRKAKARCNHETPTCQRCVRRRMICFYDPAPMTKSRTASAPDKTSTPLNIDKEQGHLVLRSSPQPSSVVPTTLSSAAASSARDSLFRRPVTGYGTTKFNATFSENQEEFGFGSVLSNVNSVSRENGLPTNQNQSFSISSQREKIRFGVNILRRFPTLRTQEILLDFLEYHSNPWVSPRMTRHCLASIRSKYGEQLRRCEGLTNVASELCANTETAIHLAQDDEWYNWFSGQSLRWEMIGIIFTVFGVSFYSRQEWDPIFNLPEQHGRNRKMAATYMRECADDCLKMCEEMNANEMIIILMKNLARLESVLVGDESDRLVSRSGSMMSCFMAVGLHRLPNNAKVTPFSEWRCSLAASAYHIDKSEAIFAAQPPCLNRFYCTYRMPLDLSDDEICGGTAAFDTAVNNLDAHGWNTDGKIHTNTLLRANCSLSPIWEDILEKTLGVNPQFSSVDIDSAIEKLDEIEAQYPRQIQYFNITEWSEKQNSSTEMYLVIRIHLDVLRCHFLLERLKVSRGFASGQKLLGVAQKMMTATLSFWLNRDKLSSHVSAFSWFVVCYGIPSAGVLCVELLKMSKPEFQPLFFSRSEIIQSLSMFLGFLDWIRPTDGNYDLCRKLLRVIGKIMDTVLDAPSLLRSEINDPPNYDVNKLPCDSSEDPLSSSMTMPAIGADDLNWLNTIDWTQGDWLDFNQPTNFT